MTNNITNAILFLLTSDNRFINIKFYVSINYDYIHVLTNTSPFSANPDNNNNKLLLDFLCDLFKIKIENINIQLETNAIFDVNISLKDCDLSTINKLLIFS